MGQVPTAWCRDGQAVGLGGDLHLHLQVASGGSSDTPRSGSAASSCVPSRQRPERSIGSSAPAEAAWLLAGLPRELAETLRETGQCAALRCRPWLSPGAFRGLQRHLQRCDLQRLAEGYREVERSEDCSYSLPTHVPWTELDGDHVVSAGQVFRLFDMPKEKHKHLRRIGLQALRQGKVAVALLAGGAHFRLGAGERPAGCLRRALQLRSGKSILQLCCERVRRIAALCAAGKPQVRPSIPVFVMTSQLTHRSVVELFEASGHFGLPAQDVIFFEQRVRPVLSHSGQLLPQSLGGEVAHAPGGTGQALHALASCSGLEQLRDRGVEYLHLVGTENVLAKVCDPVLIGFGRDLDLDCICKVVERADVAEDLELFCVKQRPVSTQFADVEEAACGVEPSEAPGEVLNLKGASGELCYCGSINSVFMALSYVETVVGRPVHQRRIARPVPYLDFHLAPGPEGELPPPPGEARPGVATCSWPAEAASPDLAFQRALLKAAGEVQAHCQPGPEDTFAAWRCDVDLDCGGPLAVVRVRGARPGRAALPQSLHGPGGAEAALAGQKAGAELRCSLVVPRTPNAWVLETSLLDYFAFADRAVALQVARASEFAPVRESSGRHSPEHARRAMHLLHCGWLTRAGAFLQPTMDSSALAEISPLLSYDGDDLSELGLLAAGPVRLPCHLAGPEEREEPPQAGEASDGLDTRPYYLQEYPRRPEVSLSHAPRFLHGHSSARRAARAAPPTPPLREPCGDDLRFEGL